ALQPAKLARPVRIPAAQLSGDQLTELSRQVNRSLARRFTMFVHRDAAYYRRLAKEQEASGGRLEILLEDGVPVCARCSAREEFPPMMVRILDLEAFLAGVQTGKAQTCIWRIRDGLLPGNDGLFEVTLTRQGGRLRRLERLPGEARRMEKREWEAGNRDAGCPEPGQIRELDISQVPEALGEDNPFLHAMICEVV
ncbi:MAG: hypothetical protein Q4E91_02785, partial [Lachnospiraceae bacterium]|nr:hypothetical protein [Lachnospiraceae bacterium]